jgi:heme-degrading monooxygenase HmoA
MNRPTRASYERLARTAARERWAYPPPRPHVVDRKERDMYGTIARLKVSRENLEKLDAMTAEQLSRNVPGFRAVNVLVPDEHDDEAYLVVFFEDKASYTKNADDPAQHEDYLKMRALLDADPEWIDGEWKSYWAS